MLFIDKGSYGEPWTLKFLKRQHFSFFLIEQFENISLILLEYKLISDANFFLDVNIYTNES